MFFIFIFSSVAFGGEGREERKREEKSELSSCSCCSPASTSLTPPLDLPPPPSKHRETKRTAAASALCASSLSWNESRKNCAVLLTAVLSPPGTKTPIANSASMHRSGSLW